MKETITSKKWGLGSLALVLSIIAIIWSFNMPWLDDFCLGDIVLDYMGIPIWSNGTSGTHYTVFYSFVFFVPAFAFGMWKKNDLFAKVGRRIAGFFIATMSIIFFVFSVP